MLELFAAREGVFAEQTPSGEYRPVRPERHITTEDILAHLEGAKSYAIYPVLRDNTCRFICFDVDLSKEEVEAAGTNLDGLRQRPMPTVDAILASLPAIGLTRESALIEEREGVGTTSGCLSRTLSGPR